MTEDSHADYPGQGGEGDLYRNIHIKRMLELRAIQQIDRGRRLGPIALAQKHVRDQEEWIRDHGATLEGYITKYGTSEDPFYGTLGGPAIYASDTLYLYLLTNQMRDEARRARRPRKVHPSGYPWRCSCSLTGIPHDELGGTLPHYWLDADNEAIGLRRAHETKG